MSIALSIFMLTCIIVGLVYYSKYKKNYDAAHMSAQELYDQRVAAEKAAADAQAFAHVSSTDYIINHIEYSKEVTNYVEVPKDFKTTAKLDEITANLLTQYMGAVKLTNLSYEMLKTDVQDNYALFIFKDTKRNYTMRLYVQTTSTGPYGYMYTTKEFDND